jgi:hypothetical protein
VTVRQTYLGSFFLNPENVRSLCLGTIWNLIIGTELSELEYQFEVYKGPVRKAYVHWDREGSKAFAILF